MSRRLPWQLFVASVLLVLLATLATLQYRWLGEVSDAERERMRASLRTRTSEFAQEFDAELTRTYVAFHVDGDRLGAEAGATLADAYARWRSSSAAPALVKDVYLVEGPTFESARVRRLDADRKTMEQMPLPAEVRASLTRAHQFLPQMRGMPGPFLLPDAVDSRIPALIVAVPFIKRIEDGAGNVIVTTDPAAVSARAIVVVLDSERLRHEMLEPLVTKYFGERPDVGSTLPPQRPEPRGEPHRVQVLRSPSDCVVTIVRRDEPDTVIYNSGDATVDAAGADVTTGIFDLRMDELNRLADGRGGVGTHAIVGEQRMAITIVRRANGPDGKRVLMAGGPGNDVQGAWQVRVRYRSGSLDAIVARSRRRNAAISLGVLGLLAASVVLIIAATERQRRLARQQMEFVAAVSHELRTPLAVICSAGENLADGVVAEGPQVKRYGTLIQSEGRRLRDMVERVLQFAGVSSGRASRPHTDVDVTRVIADAVGGVSSEARERGISIDVHSNGTLPPVRGDGDALRSAVQNILGNAVKYSAAGTTVDVGAALHGSTVQIRVADRGLGIDADDLPHIFKPFHRGRRAVEAQVRGTGIGLSVVRHVVDAHQGQVRVESRPGEGTTVTVVLPVSRASEASEVSDTSDTSDTRP